LAEYIFNNSVLHMEMQEKKGAREIHYVRYNEHIHPKQIIVKKGVFIQQSFLGRIHSVLHIEMQEKKRSS